MKQQPRRPPEGSRLSAAAKSAAAMMTLLFLLLAEFAVAQQGLAPSSSPHPAAAGAAAAQTHAAMGHAMAPSKIIAAVGTGAPADAPAAAATAAAAAAAPSAANNATAATKKKPGDEASSTSPSTPTPTPASASTVCPSIARSPTRHVVLVVTGATYVLADGSGKAASEREAGAATGAGVAAPPRRLLEGMLAVNGSVLGPTLEFEEGEDVSIDIVNEIDAPDGGSGNTTTSVHWHGLDLPGAAWADGVSGVTQRAVPRGVSFRSRFRAGPVGTHWYHAREYCFARAPTKRDAS